MTWASGLRALSVDYDAGLRSVLPNAISDRHRIDVTGSVILGHNAKEFPFRLKDDDMSVLKC